MAEDQEDSPLPQLPRYDETELAESGGSVADSGNIIKSSDDWVV